MGEYVNYFLAFGQIVAYIVSIVWLYAKLNTMLCLHEQKLDRIEEHAKYTNGKVAEVMEWKLKNEDFLEGLK